jgi:hypothetical protein
VLAQRSSGGAQYVDVRMPERPVAGGLPAETGAPSEPSPDAEGVIPAAPVPAPSPTGTAPSTTDTAPSTTPGPADPGATNPQP